MDPGVLEITFGLLETLCFLCQYGNDLSDADVKIFLPSVNCIIGEQKIYFTGCLFLVAKIFSFEIPFSQHIEELD